MLDDRNLEDDENIAPYATWTRDDNEVRIPHMNHRLRRVILR